MQKDHKLATKTKLQKKLPRIIPNRFCEAKGKRLIHQINGIDTDTG